MVNKLSLSQRAISPGSTSQVVGTWCDSFIKTITITHRGLVKQLAPLSSCLISERFLFSLWESRRKSRHYWTRLLLCSCHNETKYGSNWVLIGAKMIITVQHELLSVMLNHSNCQQYKSSRGQKMLPHDAIKFNTDIYLSHIWAFFAQQYKSRYRLHWPNAFYFIFSFWTIIVTNFVKNAKFFLNSIL